MSEGALHKDRFEAIEAFLLGTMGPEERERFQQDLAADATLREEVELQRENILAVELAGVSRTLQAMRAEQGEADPSSSGGSWTTYLKYAAMVSVLVLGAVWWFTRPAANERLYAEYYAKDPGLPVPMSATDHYAFHDAMVDYKVGRYAKAVAKWEALRGTALPSDTLDYYLGCALLEQGHTARAETLFQDVADRSRSVFSHKARWRLFLILLKRDPEGLSRSWQVDPASPYAGKERAVLKKLRS